MANQRVRVFQNGYRIRGSHHQRIRNGPIQSGDALNAGIAKIGDQRNIGVRKAKGVGPKESVKQ